jgi:hypothetical protein
MAQPMGRMNPPDPPHVVTSTGPGGPQQDWQSTGAPPVVEGWKTVDAESGTAALNGHVTSSFEDGPGRWKQT